MQVNVVMDVSEKQTEKCHCHNILYSFLTTICGSTKILNNPLYGICHQIKSDVDANNSQKAYIDAPLSLKTYVLCL